MFTTPLLAQQNDTSTELVFTVNAPGAAPFLYFDTTENRYIGVVAEFFEYMNAKSGITTKNVNAIRARSEQLIYDGRADVFLSSPAWLSHPEKVVFTNPLSMSHTFLYSSEPFKRHSLHAGSQCLTTLSQK